MRESGHAPSVVLEFMQSACMQDADYAVLNRFAGGLSLEFHKILNAASVQVKAAGELV